MCDKETGRRLQECFADIKEIFADYDEWDKETEEAGEDDEADDIDYAEIFADYEYDCDYDYGWQYQDYPAGDETEKWRKEVFNRERNIRRDSRGRLNKGAQLAKGSGYDKMAIWLKYRSGMGISKIMEETGCSRATVYNAIKRYKGQWGDLEEELPFN